MSTNNTDTLRLIEEATTKFNEYAESQKDFQAPQAQITIELEPDETTTVHIETEYKGTHYCFQSIQEKDINDIYNYLNSQPLVRAKYANGDTLSLEATSARVNTLANRFRNKNSPLYLYSGFVVSDSETGTFLGMANLGGGSKPGTSEMARLNRIECWSHLPDALSTYAVTDNHIMNQKTYNGIGTVETSVLLQYATRLKEEGYKVNGHILQAVVSTARLDNEGSWKSNAKAGMKLYTVTVAPGYGSSLRYELHKNI